MFCPLFLPHCLCCHFRLRGYYGFLTRRYREDIEKIKWHNVSFILGVWHGFCHNTFCIILLKRMKKVSLLLILLLAISTVAIAQKTLSGTIVSKNDGQPIEMATVRLFAYPKMSMPEPPAGMPNPPAGRPTPPLGMPNMPFNPAEMPDSIMIQGAQTYHDGLFILNNIPAGKYKLIVSSVGYNEYSQWVEMKKEDLDLPTIRLVEQVQHLAEVNVQGRAAEMTVKGDTIEYNTAAYQVAENANVEDLLKKMNGVEVDKEGNVTINGEEIKGVRIDGKKFFGNDVQTATKNIPC